MPEQQFFWTELLTPAIYKVHYWINTAFILKARVETRTLAMYHIPLCKMVRKAVALKWGFMHAPLNAHVYTQPVYKVRVRP